MATDLMEADEAVHLVRVENSGVIAVFDTTGHLTCLSTE